MRPNRPRRSLWAVLIGGCLVMAGLAANHSTAANERIRQYVSYGLQGDLRPAAALFQSTPDAPLTAAESTLSQQFQRRFVDRTEIFDHSAPPPGAREVMAIYRRYWTKSLMGELEGDAGEAYLTSGLRSFV